MVRFDLSDDSITVNIPVGSIEELRAYQQSLLLLLNNVDVEDADPPTLAAVEKVYQLLTYLTPEQSTTDSLESLRFLLKGK